MSSIKFTNPGDWTTIEGHLAGATGERFAFAFTDLISNGANGPVVKVVDVVLINDSEVEAHRTGWSISDDAWTEFTTELPHRVTVLLSFTITGSGRPASRRPTKRHWHPWCVRDRSLGRLLRGSSLG